MIAKAKIKFARVSEKKARDVVNLIRGRKAQDAVDIVDNLNKGSSKIVAKLLKSVISNAKPVEADVSNLYVSKITVDQATPLKRFRAQAFGRAAVILKRTSHIVIELDRVKKVVSSNKPKKVAAKKKAVKRVERRSE
ncbi:MAG: 50S ribosomal protein L22 [Candidatus Omnitrophica bacterium]|nr:50S ribosomal protein L22 [Candidatus Omnitrophota bacterium]